MLKRTLLVLLTGLALHGLGTVSSDISESKDFKNYLMTVTILYDNNPYDHRLKTTWGFSCLIEFRGRTILFDTGRDGETLLKNMRILKKDPRMVEMVVLSHIHGDHTGGLWSILGEKPTLKVYIPESFPQAFERRVKKYGAEVVRVDVPLEIDRGIYLTGEMDHGIKEQSLIIKTSKGMTLITGCAHPGIIEIIKKVKTIAREDIYMVVGGWHLSSTGEREIKGIIDTFLRMRIQKVAPCHCTGDRAMAMFKNVYREKFIEVGAGRIIEF